jgi:hypothetical protein
MTKYDKTLVMSFYRFAELIKCDKMRVVQSWSNRFIHTCETHVKFVYADKVFNTLVPPRKKTKFPLINGYSYPYTMDYSLRENGE